MILGIDPGLGGALAYFDGITLSIRGMPTARKQVNRHDRLVICEPGLHALLRSCRKKASIMVIEQVGGLPGQSGSAAFNFGHGVGLLRGMGRALGYRIEEVAPGRWTGALGAMWTDKDQRRQMAAALWPDHAHEFARKKDDGRADAALIAKYGWEVFGERPGCSS